MITMKYTILLFFLSLFTISNGQDISVYNQKTNDNFVLPALSTGVSIHEFQLLSRNFRMIDMFYSVFVPGYVHFKAKDRNTGYVLLTTELVGVSAIGYAYHRTKSDLTQELNGNSQSLKFDKVGRNSLLVGFTLIAGSYIFDIIHGSYRLHKKQEQIRFNYGTKMSMSAVGQPVASNIPIIGFSYQF